MKPVKYKNWSIVALEYSGYCATSENYDGSPETWQDEVVFASSIKDIKLEIDDYINGVDK